MEGVVASLHEGALACDIERVRAALDEGADVGEGYRVHRIHPRDGVRIAHRDGRDAKRLVTHCERFLDDPARRPAHRDLGPLQPRYAHPHGDLAHRPYPALFLGRDLVGQGAGARAQGWVIVCASPIRSILSESDSTSTNYWLYVIKRV